MGGRAALLAIVLVGCEPTFEDGHLVEDLRILAVRVDPPEARIGEEVGLEVLAVTPDGAVDEVHTWQCAARGGMRQGCETFEDSVDLGRGAEARLVIGEDWRRLLDRAGGLPVHQVVTIVADRGAEVARAIKRVVVSDEEVANANPVLEELLLGDEEPGGASEPFRAARGAAVAIRPSIAEGSVERYWKVRLDGTRDATRETLFVSYYYTCGSAPRLRSGEPEDLGATFRAPKEAGPCRLWAILRDDRGGVGWAERAIQIE